MPGINRPGVRTMEDGRHAGERYVQLSGIAQPITTTQDTDVLEIDGGSGSFDLDITGASGTSPTLDAVLKTSKDKTTWRTVATFTQATAAGTERKGATESLDRYLKATITIGGTTPSFTGVKISGDVK